MDDKLTFSGQPDKNSSVERTCKAEFRRICRMFPNASPESHVVVDVAAEDTGFAEWVSELGHQVDPLTLGCFFRISKEESRIVLQFVDQSYPFTFRHEVGHWMDSFTKGPNVYRFHSHESPHLHSWRASLEPMQKRLRSDIDQFEGAIREACPWYINWLLGNEGIRAKLFSRFPDYFEEVKAEFDRIDLTRYHASDHEVWARFICQLTDENPVDFYDRAKDVNQDHIYWSPDELEVSRKALPEDLQPI